VSATAGGVAVAEGHQLFGEGVGDGVVGAAQGGGLRGGVGQA